ncbi:MAG: hypothetical protein H7293_22610 [Candidatus Saccharibacteria bacterium]|nr:hypothetical protein [Rhodoferax sp.]
MEQVKGALTSGQPIDRAALALLLDSAGWGLHQVGVHLGEVVELLGEQAMAA